MDNAASIEKGPEGAKPYVLEFQIHMLPKSPNSMLGSHWRTRSGHAKVWDRAVWKCVWPYRPAAPLAKAKVTLTRVTHGRMDADNLRSSFKPVMDALVRNGILLDDSMAVVGEPVVLIERGEKKRGYIKVKVEGI